MVEKCKKCRFVEKVGVSYFCQRHAPVPETRPPFNRASWPRVLKYDWCGEFEKRTKK